MNQKCPTKRDSRPKKKHLLTTKQVQGKQPGKFPDPGSASFPWRGTVERFIQSYERIVAACLRKSAVAACVELLRAVWSCCSMRGMSAWSVSDLQGLTANKAHLESGVFA